MSTSCCATCQAGIPEVLERLEKELKPASPVCSLICEELLMYLLRNGEREIQVSIRGKKHRYAEIRAAGEAEDFSDPPTAEDDDQRITSEIRINLLGRYAGYYRHHYRKGVNIYRIYPDANAKEDLTEELYTFYDRAKDPGEMKPLSPLVHLFRKHPFRFALAMAVKAVKHIGALMLPVFAANIIDTVVSGARFSSGRSCPISSDYSV